MTKEFLDRDQVQARQIQLARGEVPQDMRSEGVRPLRQMRCGGIAESGPKGVVVQFRNKEFPNPTALVGYIARQGTLVKIRPDQSLFLARDYPTPERRLTGAAQVMTQLATLAKQGA